MEDAPGIANVHLYSWREAYRGLLPQDFLDSLPLTFQRRLDFWRGELKKGTAGATFVAEDENGIVGFSQFGEARDREFAGWIELRAIYLLASRQGRGTGRALLQAGFAAALGQGTSRGYCWMLEGNPTLRFYERSGARGNGKSLEAELGGKRVRELCLVWDPLPASLTDAGVGQDYPQG